MATRTGKVLAGGAIAAGAVAAAAGVGIALAARRLAGGGAHDGLPEGLVLPTGGKRFAVKTSDAAELVGEVCGDPDGPAVVLVHCWLGTRAVWAPVAQRLCEAGYRVVLYDQRGHGESTLGLEELSIARLGSDVADVVDHLDATDVVVAGHSMGGMATQAFAIEHPDRFQQRVRGVVLVSTTAHGVGYHPRLQRTAEWAVGHGMFERVVKAREVGLLAVRGASGQTARLADVAAMRELVAATDAESRVACLRAMHRMDLRSGLAGVAVPATVVSGSRDGLVPPALSRKLAAAIPGARFETIPGAGHMLPLEEPDRLAAVIAAHHAAA